MKIELTPEIEAIENMLLADGVAYTNRGAALKYTQYEIVKLLGDRQGSDELLLNLEIVEDLIGNFAAVRELPDSSGVKIEQTQMTTCEIVFSEVK